MKKFSLLLYEWTFMLTEDKSNLTVNGELCKGSVHYSSREIFADRNLSLEDLYKVVRHELTHAVLYETQIDLKRQYTEEDVCEVMAKFGEFIVNKAAEIIKAIRK